MKGHKHIGALKKDIKRALKSGTDFLLIKSVYKYSFMMLEVDCPDSFISEIMLEVAKEQQPVSFAMTHRNKPFSENEMDYGSELPQFKWQELSIYEKSFAST